MGVNDNFEFNENDKEELEVEKKFNEEGSEIAEAKTTLEEDSEHEEKEPVEDKEPLFFVDADGKTKNVYGRLAFEKATAEKLEILKKRRGKKIRTLVITVGILSLVGVAGTMAYFHNKAAKEALSVETVEETTTEEDLNVPVGNADGEKPKSAEEIIGGDAMAGGDPETQKETAEITTAEETTGESKKESLTSSEVQSTVGETTGEKATKASENNQNTATTATETLPASTEGKVETPTTVSQEEIDKNISEGQAAQSETMDSNDYNRIQDYGAWLAESIANDPEHQKDLSEHDNND